MAYDAESLLAQLKNKELEESVNIDLSNLPVGLERKQEVKRRINQSFFREAVLSSYSYRCCVTCISNTPLLEACHISGWADHRAYDKYLMAITPDYEIVISDIMLGGTKDEVTISFLKGLQGRKIIMPEKFAPEKDFLAQHYETYKQRL